MVSSQAIASKFIGLFKTVSLTFVSGLEIILNPVVLCSNRVSKSVQVPILAGITASRSPTVGAPGSDNDHWLSLTLEPGVHHGQHGHH